MKRIIIAASSTALLLASCSDPFTVTAEIGSHDYDGIKVYMTRQNPVDFSRNVTLDSTIVNDGTYTFSIDDVSDPFIITLHLEPAVREEHNVIYHDLLPVSCIASPGKITIRYTPDGIEAEGNVINDDFENMVLKPQREAHARSAAYKERTSLSDSINFFYSMARPGYIEFVRKYAATDAGAALFYGRPKEFYPQDVYESIESRIAPGIAAAWSDKQERMRKEAEKMLASREAASVGKEYADFSSVTAAGESVRLSEAIRNGRIMLLDFWASWCRPCRDEIPVLKKLYDTYHDAGLDIISVSLDTNADAWKKALEQERMPWPQWSDLKGFDCDAASVYVVHAIPFIVLIGPDGKIAMLNLRGEILEDKIGELLGK